MFFWLLPGLYRCRKAKEHTGDVVGFPGFRRTQLVRGDDTVQTSVSLGYGAFLICPNYTLPTLFLLTGIYLFKLECSRPLLHSPDTRWEPEPRATEGQPCKAKDGVQS